MADRKAWRQWDERIMQGPRNVIRLYFLFFILLFPPCNPASGGDLTTDGATAAHLRRDTAFSAPRTWLALEPSGVDTSPPNIVTAECAQCMSPEQARNTIASEASRAVQALKSRDMNALSKLVHPNGVRFSPYAFLDKKADVRLTPAMLRGALADHKVRVWGTYDGSGKPIRLSFPDYFKRFVYDRDFADASQVFYNGEREARSTTHDNSREEYPDAIVVEFYVPASGGYEGIDFRSLRLIFEQYRGAWYLVHIVHDEWTV